MDNDELEEPVAVTVIDYGISATRRYHVTLDMAWSVSRLAQTICDIRTQKGHPENNQEPFVMVCSGQLLAPPDDPLENYADLIKPGAAIFLMKDQSTAYDTGPIAESPPRSSVHNGGSPMPFPSLSPQRIAKLRLIDEQDISSGLKRIAEQQREEEERDSILGTSMMKALDKFVSEPELLMRVLNASPVVRSMRSNHPELASLLNDPETWKQAIQASQHPGVSKELVRSSDRAMANLESMPGGFEALRKMQSTFQTPLFDSAGFGGPDSDGEDKDYYSSSHSSSSNSCSDMQDALSSCDGDDDDDDGGDPDADPDNYGIESRRNHHHHDHDHLMRMHKKVEINPRRKRRKKQQITDFSTPFPLPAKWAGHNELDFYSSRAVAVGTTIHTGGSGLRPTGPAGPNALAPGRQSGSNGSGGPVGPIGPTGPIGPGGPPVYYPSSLFSLSKDRRATPEFIPFSPRNAGGDTTGIVVSEGTPISSPLTIGSRSPEDDPTNEARPTRVWGHNNATVAEPSPSVVGEKSREAPQERRSTNQVSAWCYYAISVFLYGLVKTVRVLFSWCFSLLDGKKNFDETDTTAIMTTGTGTTTGPTTINPAKEGVGMNSDPIDKQRRRIIKKNQPWKYDAKF